MLTHTEAAILAKVRTFVTKEFLYMRPGFSLGDEDSLMQTGVLDSMGVLEVMTFLEHTFDVSPDDDEITEANLGSLRAIARFTASKAAGKGVHRVGYTDALPTHPPAR